jgi:hypothetical protein
LLAGDFSTPPEESQYSKDWLRIAEKDWRRVDRAIGGGDTEEAGYSLQHAIESYSGGVSRGEDPAGVVPCGEHKGGWGIPKGSPDRPAAGEYGRILDPRSMQREGGVGGGCPTGINLSADQSDTPHSKSAVGNCADHPKTYENMQVLSVVPEDLRG